MVRERGMGCERCGVVGDWLVMAFGIEGIDGVGAGGAGI